MIKLVVHEGIGCSHGVVSPEDFGAWYVLRLYSELSLIQGKLKIGGQSELKRVILGVVPLHGSGIGHGGSTAERRFNAVGSLSHPRYPWYGYVPLHTSVHASVHKNHRQVLLHAQSRRIWVAPQRVAEVQVRTALYKPSRAGAQSIGDFPDSLQDLRLSPDTNWMWLHRLTATQESALSVLPFYNFLFINVSPFRIIFSCEGFFSFSLTVLVRFFAELS